MDGEQANMASNTTVVDLNLSDGELSDAVYPSNLYSVLVNDGIQVGDTPSRKIYLAIYLEVLHSWDSPKNVHRHPVGSNTCPWLNLP